MQSRHAAAVVPYLLLLGWCAIFAAAAAAADSTLVGVSTDVELQRALEQPQVQHIVVLKDIQFQPETWNMPPESSPAYVLKRNLTISSRPRFNQLDIAFLGSSWLSLSSGVWLVLEDLILEQARYGSGMQLDWVAPSAGAVVLLHNVVVARHLCISDVNETAAVAVMPRLPGFPGEQRAHYVEDQCFAGVCVPKVLVYDSFTKTSTFTADSAAGGYSMVFENTTKLCLGWAKHCTDPGTADACMQRALDALPAAAPTPGRIAAAAESAGTNRRLQVVVPAAIGSILGAAVMLVVILLLRWSHQRRSQAGGKAGTAFGSAPGTAGGCMQDMPENIRRPSLHDLTGPHVYPNKDVDCVDLVVHPDSRPDSVTASSQLNKSNGAVPQAAVSAPAAPTPPQQDGICIQDNWELAAWKTSSHSFKRLSQQQHGAGDAMQGLDSGGQLITTSLPVSPFAERVLSSHALILQGTGASTSQAVMAANKISLGVCIGAGASARVYRGRWQGVDVAVKVMQHSQAAAASVANEIDLMMGFHHPHLVCAYHFVTWRRRRDSGGVNTVQQQSDEQQVVPFVQQTSSSSSGHTSSSSFPTLTAPGNVPEEECPEDTQTWIVQEYCNAGSLGDYAIIHGERQQGQLPNGHAMLRLLFRLREVADGMHYLHDTARVVHCDLKSSNILLCVAPTAPYGRTAKIADFGLARVYAAGETHKSTRTLGTINHMAPELLRWGKASAAADVYSFGIMMWELLTGGVAFQGWQWGAIIENVALVGQRPPIPEHAPEDYCLLMESCWQQEPLQRPTFAEVLRCINIMITSRQQELMEQQVAQLCDPMASPASALTGTHCEDSHPSLATTYTAGIDVGLTSSTSSGGEFEMLRVGSMRRLSGVSVGTTMSTNLVSFTAAGASPVPGQVRTLSGRLLTKPSGQALSGSLLGEKVHRLPQEGQPTKQQQMRQPGAAGMGVSAGHRQSVSGTGHQHEEYGPQDL